MQNAEKTSSDNATISVEHLQELLAEKQPVTVVDIRPDDERAEWYIPGSVHVDAHDELWKGRSGGLETLSLPSSQPVVTVCGAGRTSLLAADHLRNMGYDVYSLEGGMQAWSLAWNSAEVALTESDAKLIQVRRTGKGCLSYIIAAGDHAAVIDPSLPPSVYLGIASERGWKIEAVLDTHVHADHLSRARALAREADARHYLPEQDRSSFPYSPLRSGNTVSLGASKIEMIATPGHTPESVTYRLDGAALFTGDTLFLSSVGRPDLEATPEQARERARQLYRSLQELVDLKPTTIVLPGHVSKPIEFDGRAIYATLGAVREQADLLSLSENDFVERVTRAMPETPANHQRIIKLNESGETELAALTELELGANRCAVS